MKVRPTITGLRNELREVTLQRDAMVASYSGLLRRYLAAQAALTAIAQDRWPRLSRALAAAACSSPMPDIALSWRERERRGLLPKRDLIRDPIRFDFNVLELPANAVLVVRFSDARGVDELEAVSRTLTEWLDRQNRGDVKLLVTAPEVDIKVSNPPPPPSRRPSLHPFERLW